MLPHVFGIHVRAGQTGEDVGAATVRVNTALGRYDGLDSGRHTAFPMFGRVSDEMAADRISRKLAGHTLGVVGLGAIGRKVAAMGVALGMRVIGYDPYVTELPPGVTASPLHSLFQSSDVVSLHCPLTTENRNMINRNTLGLFREGAILINTARGGLIEESALVHALLEGRLRSAGLDSFANEPLPAEHIFRGVPNLIMTPHVGSLTSDTYKSMGVACAHNILGVLRGA